MTNEIAIGDRVRLSEGNDGVASLWLNDGDGYVGTVRELSPTAAVIELEHELELSGHEWQDFGFGSPQALRTVTEVRGRWIVTMHTWMGARWVSPAAPVHIGVCSSQPSLAAIPAGGGAGVWVESHATVALEPAGSPTAPSAPAAAPGPAGAGPVEEPRRKQRKRWFFQR